MTTVYLNAKGELNKVFQVMGACRARQVKFLECRPGNVRPLPAVFWHIKTRALSDFGGFEFLSLFELPAVCKSVHK